jgi:hypothetical protein
MYISRFRSKEVNSDTMTESDFIFNTIFAAPYGQRNTTVHTEKRVQNPYFLEVKYEYLMAHL